MLGSSQQKTVFVTGRGQSVSIEWQGSLLEIVPYLNREHPDPPELSELEAIATKFLAFRALKVRLKDVQEPAGRNLYSYTVEPLLVHMAKA